MTNSYGYTSLSVTNVIFENFLIKIIGNGIDNFIQSQDLKEIWEENIFLSESLNPRQMYIVNILESYYRCKLLLVDEVDKTAIVSLIDIGKEIPSTFDQVIGYF